MGGLVNMFGCPEIEKEDVQRVAQYRPRQICFASTHQKALRKSEGPTYVGSFSVPFDTTIGRVFGEETGRQLFPSKKSNGYWRSIKTEEEFEQIKSWIENQGTRIFLRDCLPLSIALGFNRPGPDEPYTALGRWENKAKQHRDARAIRRLTDAFCEAISDLPSYRDCRLICAVPAHPDKEFDLPRELAARVAQELGLDDLTGRFRFARPKRSIKTAPAAQKWDLWEDCGLSFTPGLEGHRPVILLDDKYQSGVTLQYVASKLLQASASEVYGLCAVKTLRNTDNR